MEQAVLVYLDGQSLDAEVYEKYDLATLEDKLTHAIEEHKVGEFDGNELGPTEVTLYMYGPDSEKLFQAIEPVLRNYPLCQKGRIEIRPGPPGTPCRNVQL